MANGTVIFKMPDGQVNIPRGPMLGMDQEPMPPSQRTWNLGSTIPSGIGMGIAISIFLINALAIPMGLNFWQMIWVGGLSSAFMGFLWVLNGAWELKFALPFTVQMRGV